MKEADNSLLRLPFDQYSRQRRAAQLIDVLRVGDESFKILDVGGYKGATKLFHPKDKVTVLDVFDVEDKDYVKGDATALDIDNDSYDIVVNFDVFEHIPRDKRAAFINECTRVAKRALIVAAPVGTKMNTYAEIQVNELYKGLHGKDHRWLYEHIDYKLPEPLLAGDLMKAAGLRINSFTSNYLPAWSLMQSTIFGASKFDVIGKRIDALYEDYNSLLASDGTPDTEENYRSILIGVKAEKDLRTVRSQITNIFMDKAEYFENYVKLNLAVTKTLIEAMDELFVANETHISQSTRAAQDRDQLKASQEQTIAQLETLRQDYQRIVNSKVYRYGRKLSKGIHSPRTLADKIRLKK